MARLVLSLLGPFRVSLDEQPITRFESVKVRALLAYLASDSSRPHRRETLASLLWPDWPSQSASSNLRYALADLRKNIGDRVANPPYLVIDRERIQLNREADVWVDLMEFEQAIQQSSTTHLKSAIGLYRGSFLEGFSLPDSAPFEEWLLAKREYLSQQMLKLLSKQTEGCIEQGEYEQAEEYAHRQIEMEPWREKAYDQLMRALCLRGERVQALTQFENLRKALQRELKVEPSQETLQLYRQIRDGKVEGPTETLIKETALVVEPPIYAEKPRHKLPKLLTSFIGREKEQQEVILLVKENRLVTLTGSGGIGKTRLCQQVGHNLLNEYPDGVWFISLDSLSDPALVPQTVASIFDIRESQHQPVIEILKDVLRQKTALLILDNCEHLPEACAQLITDLLMNCPNLAILATSRETLNVAGEAVYSMPSLSLPEHHVSLDDLSEYESVKLFAERAALAVSSFRVTKENIHIVVDICHRVDGLPLAIELAAVRVNILSVEEILKQLQDSFSLLAAGGRIGIPRHQTLRASMDWSWGLLSETEQIFLQQLSIFAGGWTLEAAQAVCDGDVLSLTGALVNKSLIAVDREAGRETRYRFHEIVRQYARGKLNDSGESSQLQDRHAAYYLDVAEQFEAILYENELRAAERLKHLDADFVNIRAALAWTLDGTKPEKAINAARVLKEYWIMRGLFGEGRAWLEKALSQVEQAQPSLSLAGVLFHLGDIIHHSASDDAQAIEYIEKARAMYQDLGDRLGYARATQRLADIRLKEEYFAESAAVFKELGAEGDLASALWGWGGFKEECHDFEGARSLLEAAERLYRKLGSWNIGAVQATLAWTYWRLGKPERARDLFKQGLTTLRVVDNQWGLLILLASQGELEMELASDSAGLHRAEAILLEDLEIARKFGSKATFFAYITALLGNVAQKQNRYSLAVERFRESLLILQELGQRSWQNSPSIIGRCLLGLTEAGASLERAVFSARVLGAMQRLQVSVEVLSVQDLRGWITPADFERVTALVRSQLGEQTFQSAWDAGQAMTLEETIAYALGEEST
jgi:predicted ATPase/DNA-binding SARP family transcriptional activator